MQSSVSRSTRPIRQVLEGRLAVEVLGVLRLEEIARPVARQEGPQPDRRRVDRPVTEGLERQDHELPEVLRDVTLEA